MSPWTNGYHLAATGNDILVECNHFSEKKGEIYLTSQSFYCI